MATTRRKPAPSAGPTAGRAPLDRLALESALAVGLRPLLAGIELLADSLRVLSDLEGAASMDGALAERLCVACPTWMNPLHAGAGAGFEALADLAHVARDVLRDIEAKVDGAPSAAR